MTDGKAILGTNTRVKQMQAKKNAYAEKLLLLAIRLCCAKMAKDGISLAATTEIRNKQYVTELESFEKNINANLASPKSQQYISCLRKVLVNFGRADLDMTRDWVIVKASEHDAPFGYTRFTMLRDNYWPKLNAAVALDGWDSEDLNWIVGQNAINMRRTLGKMDEGAYGDYWAEKVLETKCQGFNSGVRYYDGVFSLYFNFLQFQYLLLLKEARGCRVHIKDLAKCPEKDLLGFKRIIDFYNSLPAKHALPRVDCLDGFFKEKMSEQPEIEW